MQIEVMHVDIQVKDSLQIAKRTIGQIRLMLIATKLVPPAIFLFHVETCDGIWG